MILVSDVVSRVRYVVNDTTGAYRNTDLEIFSWITDALNVMLLAQPDLFAKGGNMTTVGGVDQTVAGFARAVAFMSVDGYPKFDVDSMDVFRPGWPNDTPAVMKQWAPGTAGPNSFLLYPPSPGGQPIAVFYAEAPATVTTLTGTLDIPNSYIAPIVQYCVGMVEAKDDENVNSNRSAQAKADFMAMIKGA